MKNVTATRFCAFLFFIIFVSSAFPVKPPGKPIIGLFAPNQKSESETTIRHTLEGFGIPFKENNSFSALTDCKSVIVAGPFSEDLLNFTEVRSIFQYVEKGGNLFLAGEIGKSLFPLAGLSEIKPDKHRFIIRIGSQSDDPILGYVNRPAEFQITLGDQSLSNTTMTTFSVVSPQGNVLAIFDDRSAAFTNYTHSGRGAVYYLGIGLEATIHDNLYNTNTKYLNDLTSFSSPRDMFPLFIKAFYESTVKNVISISLIPSPYTSAVVLTHDVNTLEAFKGAPLFAQIEKRLNVKSTFFVTTKTFSDSTGPAIFTSDNKKIMSQLIDSGFDIGSQTVSGITSSLQIKKGTKLFTKDEYLPEKEKTLFGECLASQWFLEEIGARVNSLRPGALGLKPGFDSVIKECRYKIISNHVPGILSGNLPTYSATEQTNKDNDILEIPVTINADEYKNRFSSTERDKLIDEWIGIIEQNMENGSITTISISTENSSDRLKTLESLILRLKSRGSWVGDINAYSEFYRLRNGIKIKSLSVNGSNFRINLTASSENIPPEFNLILKTSPEIKRISVRDSKDNYLGFVSMRSKEGVRLSHLGLKARYSRIQLRLITAIGTLFLLTIISLCIIIIAKRLRRPGPLSEKRAAEHEERVFAILASDIHQDDKVRMLRKLGNPGATRPILLKQTEFLKGADAETLGYIYLRMQFFRQDVRKTKDERFWKRAEAAYALGHFAMPESEIHLLMLLNDKHSEVRIAAANSLGMLKAIKKIPRIMEAVIKSDAWTGSMMLQGLLPMKMEACVALHAMLEDPYLQRPLLLAVVRAMGALRDIGGVPVLLKHLEDGSVSLKLAILEALRKIGDENVLSRIALLFEMDNRDIRLAVLKTLSGIGNPSAVPLILKIIDNAQVPIAREAMRALTKLEEKGKEALMDLLYHERAEIPLLALQVIEESGLFEAIAKDLNDDSDKSRKRASDRFFRRAFRLGFRRLMDDLSTLKEYHYLKTYISSEEGK